MRTLAIVQARMTSTRLPGKVLKTILGRPMLSLQLERMRRSRRLDGIVVATTTNAADEPIVVLCGREGVPVHRGSEDDVLGRYAGAAREFDAGVVVRVTSDCPLIEPGLIDESVGLLADGGGKFDYVSNMLHPTYPYGLAVEAFPARVLFEADAAARSEAEREHVTPYIYAHPERYRLHSLRRSPDLSHHRWTVDTPEDFELVSRIFGALYPREPAFGMEQVLELLAKHPDWSEINRHVVQRKPAPNRVA